MFDDFIELLKEKLTHQIGTNIRFMPLDDILHNQQIDNCYKVFFDAEVRWWIYEEQLRRSNNPLFNFGANEFTPLFDSYDVLLYKNARFDRPTIKSVIDSAVTTRFNYLLRPRVALKWFVFRGEPTKQYHEIIKRLSYFSDYGYLLQGFVDYVKENIFLKSENDLFSILEFTNIIEKVDTDYLFALRPEQFVELLFPMIAAFNPEITNIDFKTEFPVEALIVFLDDKGIEPLKASAEHILITKSIRKINSEVFLKLIYELLHEIDRNPLQTGLNQGPTLDDGSHEDEISFELNTDYREFLDMTDDLGALDKALKDMKKNQKTEEN